jgi:hypothetical protein
MPTPVVLCLCSTQNFNKYVFDLQWIQRFSFGKHKVWSISMFCFLSVVLAFYLCNVKSNYLVKYECAFAYEIKDLETDQNYSLE